MRCFGWQPIAYKLVEFSPLFGSSILSRISCYAAPTRHTPCKWKWSRDFVYVCSRQTSFPSHIAFETFIIADLDCTLVRLIIYSSRSVFVIQTARVADGRQKWNAIWLKNTLAINFRPKRAPTNRRPADRTSTHDPTPITNLIQIQGVIYSDRRLYFLCHYPIT